MQHIIIKQDPDTMEPYIIPYRGQLWRDDQTIMWSFAANANTVSWDPSVDPPIVFRPAGGDVAAWPGSQPTPIGAKPADNDRRRYVADGGSPNPTDETIKYVYDAWVIYTTTEEGERTVHHVKLSTRSEDESVIVDPIDPEILNQPQP